MTEPTSPKPLFELERRPWLVLVGFAVSLLVVYAPALTGGFVWDDDENILYNEPLRSLGGLARIWTDPFATQQFYPLTHTSFWVQYQLFGAWTTPYHVVNVLLHACAAFLLWRLLRGLRVPGALLAACLFAFHPVSVESVAWVTERKNVLSMSLCLASAIAYLRFAGVMEPEGPKGATFRLGGWKLWSVAFTLFLLALASKTAVSVVPALLLIIVLAHRGSKRPRDALPLVPFFGLGIGAGVLTAWIERVHVNAEGAEFAWTVSERILVAGRCFWFYLGKLVWPARLMFVYPRWTIDAHVWWQWLFPLAVGSALAGVVLLRHRAGSGPALAVWGYFILIFPALGFFNVAFMRFSYVQDHFAYHASAAFFALAAAVGARICDRVTQRGPLRAALSALPIALLGALSLRQAAHYESYETLFAHAIRENPDAWMAQYNIAHHYQRAGRPSEAIPHYREMLRLHPEHFGAHNNLAAALAATGQGEEALQHFRRAAELEPDNFAARGNLAQALDDAGRHREALVHYEAALRQRPHWIKIQRRLAWMLATTADESLVDGVRSVQLAREACSETTATLPRCLDTLAAAHAAAGQFEEAVRVSEEAIAMAKRGGDGRAAERYARHRSHYLDRRRLIVSR